MKFDWQRLLHGPWFQAVKTDWQWDELLNRAIDLHGVTPISQYKAVVGPFTVWTENWPYCYGYQVEPRGSRALPSVATRRKLRAALNQCDVRLLEDFGKGEPS